MFGRKCKQCKTKLVKGEIIAKEYCSEECRDNWREQNLRPWQKKLNEGVEKWAEKPKK
jgi:hypothetical protein